MTTLAPKFPQRGASALEGGCVTINPEGPGSASVPAPEVANLGIVRPPLVYLCSILTGVALDFVSPLPFLPRALSTPLGIATLLVAVVLFSFSLRQLRAAGTPVRGNKPTTVVVRTGPYRYSRNPIYLSFSLLQLAIAIWVNSLWVLATLGPAVVLMSCVVIPREEQYLERKFGVEYLEYKACVRRWV
jgi:protein-S-isoprenylcysteine O-methyltransferase Ste14